MISEFCQIRNKPCFSKCDRINTLVKNKNMQSHSFTITFDFRLPHKLFFFIKMGKVCEAPKIFC